MVRKQAVWRCSYLPPPVRSDGVHRRQVWRADAAGQRAGRDQANLLAVLIVSDGPLWPSPLLHLAETQHNHVTRKEKKRKHCGWHFSVSHYLLVLRFDRFPQWPPSPPPASRTLSLLCTLLSLPWHSSTCYSPPLSLFLTLPHFFPPTESLCTFVLSSVQNLLFFTLWFLHLHPPLHSWLCADRLSVQPPAPPTLSAVCNSLVM